MKVKKTLISEQLLQFKHQESDIETKKIVQFRPHPKNIDNKCSKKIKENLSLQNEETKCTVRFNNSKINHLEKKENQSIYNIDNFQFSKEKKKIIKYNHSKINNYKKLLPDFLVVKLPIFVEICIDTACYIDKYLLKESNQADSFNNIQNYLENKLKFKIKLKHIYQILYLLPNFYQLFEDPSDNIVILLESCESLISRKHQLKESAYKYCKNEKNKHQIPQFKVKLEKTSINYPIKKTRSSIKYINQLDIKNKKPSEQYLQKIYEQINNKENILKKQLIKNEYNLTLKQVLDFCNILEIIYLERGVSNLYKVNLLQQLRKKGLQNCFLNDILQKLSQMGKFIQYKQGIIGNSIIHIDFEKKKQILEELNKLFRMEQVCQ